MPPSSCIQLKKNLHVTSSPHPSWLCVSLTPILQLLWHQKKSSLEIIELTTYELQVIIV